MNSIGISLALYPGDKGVMARYELSHSGERRTASLHVQLTPAERSQIEAAARAVGAPSLSLFARECLLRRLGDPPRVEGVRRNPEARRLMYELSAIGNNINQLARVANTTGVVAAVEVLRSTTDYLKRTMAHVLTL